MNYEVKTDYNTITCYWFQAPRTWLSVWIKNLIISLYTVHMTTKRDLIVSLYTDHETWTETEPERYEHH
jgi:hypothetical protein